MTRNFVDAEKYVSVDGIENALKVAKVLLETGHEVFIELDDCDIYCIHFNNSKCSYDVGGFYRLSEEQIDYIYSMSNKCNTCEEAEDGGTEDA